VVGSRRHTDDDGQLSARDAARRQGDVAAAAPAAASRCSPAGWPAL